MKKAITNLVSAAIFVTFMPFAIAGACSRDLLERFGANDLENCQCGDALKNVTLTISAPLRLVAVCDLRWPRTDRPIDLRTTRVTFDTYTDGWIPYGHLLLEGDLKLRGILEIDEGPAGMYWFFPSPPLVPKSKQAIYAEMVKIEFADEGEFWKLEIPSRFPKGACVRVDAEFEMKNIHLLTAGNDEAGARPVQYRLLSATNYRRCTR